MLTDEMKQVIAGLPEDAFAADGKPKVKNLEAAYTAAHEEIELSAADRDALWAEYLVDAEEDEDEEAPSDPDVHHVTLTASPTNPLKVIVNGRTLAVLQIGEPASIGPVAFAHMSAVPGVAFTEGQT